MCIQHTPICDNAQHMSSGFTRRKAIAIDIGGFLVDDYPKRAERIRNCANLYRYSVCDSCGRTHVSEVWFCRDRLCPLCAWLRARELGAELCAVIDIIGDKQRYIFVTLTLRNCRGHELRDTIRHLGAAWTKLSRRASVRRITEGYAKALEVTYNVATDTYHPHLHIMMAVRPSAFTRDYIKHAQWLDMWQASLGVNYTPIVDVRAVGSQTTKKAALETAKYTIKPFAYDVPQDKLQDVVRTLAGEMAGVRTVSYTGILHEVRQRRGALDENDVPINIPSRSRCDCGETLAKYEVYRWQPGVGYVFGGDGELAAGRRIHLLSASNAGGDA